MVSDQSSTIRWTNAEYGGDRNVLEAAEKEHHRVFVGEDLLVAWAVISDGDIPCLRSNMEEYSDLEQELNEDLANQGLPR